MPLKDFFYSPAGECGLDEAGRGCLAGPVFAAAVILDAGHIPSGLDDSKKLSPSSRNQLRKEIEATAAAWAVASVDAATIDELNILRASILAMHRAIRQLSLRPALLLVDGNRFTAIEDIPFRTVVGGDGIYASIAAASILAKTHRDEYMETLHRDYPAYGWDANKGYPTPHHIQALRRCGPSPFHRRTFSVKGQTSLPF